MDTSLDMTMTGVDPLIPFRAEVIVEDSIKVLSAESHRFQLELRRLTEEFRELHFPLQPLLSRLIEWFQMRCQHLIDVAEAHLDQVRDAVRRALETQLQAVKASLSQELKLLLEILQTGSAGPLGNGTDPRCTCFSTKGGATC